mmetsp:Transcript_99596/g.287513  ORF Transcript_99596/g.287513 Transcript_99596/m.287513 type:complete len:263 (-) Transcript_99596:1099-1887(-)
MSSWSPTSSFMRSSDSPASEPKCKKCFDGRPGVFFPRPSVAEKLPLACCQTESMMARSSKDSRLRSATSCSTRRSKFPPCSSMRRMTAANSSPRAVRCSSKRRARSPTSRARRAWRSASRAQRVSRSACSSCASACMPAAAACAAPASSPVPAKTPCSCSTRGKVDMAAWHSLTRACIKSMAPRNSAMSRNLASRSALTARSASWRRSVVCSCRWLWSVRWESSSCLRALVCSASCFEFLALSVSNSSFTSCTAVLHPTLTA